MRTFGSYIPTAHLATTGPVTVRCARPASAAPGAKGADRFVVKAFEALDPDRPELFWMPDAEGARTAFCGSVRRQVRMAAAAPRQWLAVHEQGDGRVPFYVADHVGLSLRKLVIWRTQLRHYALLHLARSIADALAELRRHDAGGTHGNLKLTNVLLEGDGSLEQARVRLADPHADPTAKTEADELQDVGRLIESLVLRRDAFAGVMSFEDRRPWDALGFRDGARWRDLCARLRDGECDSLDRLRDVELRRFTTRGRVVLRRAIGAGVAAAGVGAIVWLGVRYDRFDDARAALARRENDESLGALAERLAQGPKLDVVDPAIGPLAALGPRFAAMGDKLDPALLAGRRELAKFGPLKTREYEVARETAAAKVALAAAVRQLAQWRAPETFQDRAERLLGTKLVELNGLINLPNNAGYNIVRFDELRAAIRYAKLFRQLDEFRLGAGPEARLMSLADPQLTIDRIEPLVRQAWARHVEAVRTEMTRRLAALNVRTLALPAPYAAALKRIAEGEIEEQAFPEMRRMWSNVDAVVAADAALFRAYSGLLDQRDDPLLSGLGDLLKARLAASGDDLERLAAEASALAASDVWPQLAAAVRGNALAGVPEASRDALARRAEAVRQAFTQASDLPSATAALARWPDELASLRGLGDEDTAVAEVNAFARQLAAVGDAIKSPFAGDEGPALLARIDRGRALIERHNALPKIDANRETIGAIKAELAAVNVDVDRLLGPIRQREQADAQARAEVERQRQLAQLKDDEARRAELARQQAIERQQQQVAAQEQAFQAGLKQARDHLKLPAMAESYASLGATLTDAAARQRWVTQVGPYLERLASVPPDKMDDAAFEAAAAQERRRVLEAEPAAVAKQIAAAPGAAWTPPDPAQRLRALTADWTRRADEVSAELAAIDGQISGDGEANLDAINPRADAAAKRLEALGVAPRQVALFDRLDRLRQYRSATASLPASRELVETILKSRVEFGLERQVIPPVWRRLLADGDGIDFLLDASSTTGNSRAVSLLAMLPPGAAQRDLLVSLIGTLTRQPDGPRSAARWAALGAIHRDGDRELPGWVRFNAAVGALKVAAASRANANDAIDAAAFEPLRKLAAERDAPPEAVALFKEIEAARRPATPASGAVPALLQKFRVPGGGDDAMAFAVKLDLPGGRQQEELRLDFVRVGENRFLSATEVPVLLLQALEAADVPKAASSAPLEFPFLNKDKAIGTWGPVTWTFGPGGGSGTPPVRPGGANGWWVSSPRLRMVIEPNYSETTNRPSWKSPLTFLSATSARSVAERLGFELPTLADWQAARQLLGPGDFRQHAPPYNLRDAKWAEQYARVEKKNNEGIPENNWPSRQSYANNTKSASYPFNDGALFFTEVDKGPVDGGLRNLIGNVAEYVADRGPGGAYSYAIVGGSALSDVVDSLDGLVTPVEARDATLWTTRADVGFRLAFTAAPAADAGTARRSPGDIIGGAAFLRPR